MLPVRDTYDDLVRDFAWKIPEFFNMGTAVCDGWAEQEPDRVCLLHYHPDRAPDL